MSRISNRQVRLGPTSYTSEYENMHYADIPPPTPMPEDPEYEDFQEQQQISASSSHVNLHSFGYARDQRAPPYDSEVTGRAVLLQRSRSSTSMSEVQVQTDPQQQRTATSRDGTKSKQNLKQMGLNFLNARQHMALALCRDMVLVPPLFYAFNQFQYAFQTFHDNDIPSMTDISNYIPMITTASPTEYFLAGIWCIVAAYLSYQVIDGLMVRWIVTYQTSAAILRVLSMSMFLITIETGALSIFSPEGSYSLHTWILISCVLTGAYIIQNFVTSNLDLKAGYKRRTIDYYNIAVFAVVPVGFASFVSMVVLLRVLLILRLDLSGKELMEGIL